MSLKIVVIGGGMYVSGRNTAGFGTVMPALFEAVKQGIVGKIGIMTTSENSAKQTQKKVNTLRSMMGIGLEVEYFPITSAHDNPMAYVKANGYTAAIVATPDHLHCELCVKLIEMGLHCLVVKPMAPTYGEAIKMRNAARQHHVVAQVEFHKRYDESNLLLKDTIRSGELGDLLYAVIEYSQPKYIPEKAFKSWSEKTSIFQYLGVHYVDLLQFVTHYEPLHVSAWGQKSYLASKGIDTWDAMQVVIQWSGNHKQFVSTHICNWVDPESSSAVSNQTINVVGTSGRFQADQKHRGVQTVTQTSGIRDINPYFTQPYTTCSGLVRYDGYGIKSILQFLQDVSDYTQGHVSINELNEIRPSFEKCVESSRVIEMAHNSIAHQNQPIGLGV